jgi:peptidoglycan hydrolase-like protein with peptidoglycan-binding domain
MNIRDLINKLDTIDQLNEFRLKDVKAAVGNDPDPKSRAVTLAKLANDNKLPGLYDPIDGEFVDNRASRSGVPSAAVDAQLQASGLIPPNSHSSSFLGSVTGVSGDKYDQSIRQSSDTYNKSQDEIEFKQEHLKTLYGLVDQLAKATPAPTAKPDAKTDPKKPGQGTQPPVTTPVKTDNGDHRWSDAAIGGAVGGLGGLALGGPIGAALGGVGGAVTGYRVGTPEGTEHASKKLIKDESGEWVIVSEDGSGLVISDNEKPFIIEKIIESTSMSDALMESFGYTAEDNRYFRDVDGTLVEYSWDQFKGDVGDTARGIEQGATLGFGNNINAGVKSLFKGTKYKDELDKEQQADKAAQERSPWLYGGGNLAGAVGSSMIIPGSGVGNLAARGAAKLGANAALQTGAKYGAMIGGNLLLQKGADLLRSKSDLATFKAPNGNPDVQAIQAKTGMVGKELDGVPGPKTQAAIAKWQEENGLVPSGEPDPETLAAMGLEMSGGPQQQPATVAEQIASLRNMLTQLDEGKLSEGFWDSLLKGGAKLVPKLGKAIPKVPKGAIRTVKTGPMKGVNFKWNGTKWIRETGNGGTGKFAARAGTLDPATPEYKAIMKEFQAVKKAGGQSGVAAWIKKNPKKAIAIGLITAAGAGGIAGYAAGSNSDGNNGGNNGTPNQGTQPPTGTETPTAPAEEKPAVCTAEQMDLVKKIKAEIDALTPMAANDPSVARAVKEAQTAITNMKCTPPAGEDTSLGGPWDNVSQRDPAYTPPKATTAPTTAPAK